MIYGLIAVGAVAGILILLFVLPGFSLIRDHQVGVLTRKMFGKKMPQGQIVARNNEIGIQAHTLMPGLYWRLPIVWKIEKVQVTDINPDEIGVVESVDGKPIPTGRFLADEVECNSFQDAKKFLDDGGMKGPQVAILRPGTYRINTKVFTVTKHPARNVPKEQMGVVVALDGTPLPPGFIVAPKPPETSSNAQPNAKPHKFFQDGQAFLESGGYRGPQLDTLQPGQYYVNPLLFRVDLFPVQDVPPGYVAVLRSNVGKELDQSQKTPAETSLKPDLGQPVHESIETILIMDRDTRGIWNQPVAPGKYNLNPVAFTPYLVPTSAVTIDWARGKRDQEAEHANPLDERTYVHRDTSEHDKATEFFKFSQLRVTSKDGFQLDVDVRMVIRIRPENAAFIIARFGSVRNLIEQIVHPMIDSSFRNKAGEKKAIDFVQTRSELQKEALEKAREEFQLYHVEAQNLLIAYIAVDQALLDTQTQREIALQQQEQYREQTRAEQERITVQEQRARAEKQPEVVAAELAINIARNRASAAREEAEGIRDATKTRADGDAYQQREVGRGTADAYKAQADVLGSQATAILKALAEVASGSVKIVPDVLVTGNQGQQGNLFNAWLANMMRNPQGPSGATFTSRDAATDDPSSPAESPSAQGQDVDAPSSVAKASGRSRRRNSGRGKEIESSAPHYE